MSEALAEQLDLPLALRRVKLDIKHDRVFFEHPFEMRLVELDEDGWLEDLATSVRTGTYKPGPLLICDVPKARGQVRPGGYLSLADQVCYTALVGACLGPIVEATSWGDEVLDFSYRLNRKLSASDWLLNPFVGWDRFRQASLDRITNAVSYVVLADLAGYYETISIRRLLADLRQYGVSNLLTTALSECLNGWTRIRGRGIPQGFSASDLLGKLYLSGLDRTLSEMGFAHYRYVDDFRIFCRTRAEARAALTSLSSLLRERGLVLQSSKTDICSADEARLKIDGIAPRISEIRRDYLREIALVSGTSSGYMSIGAADIELSKNPDDAPVEVIERAYAAYILNGDSEFDKSLFHFLLKRLGIGRSVFALEHCTRLLVDRPEETKFILKYWTTLGITAECDEVLIKFLSSEEAVYRYQNLQLLSWRAEVETPAPTALLHVVRRLCFEELTPPYLRTICRRFLARFGSLGDLSGMKEQYFTAGSALEKSEIMCCLARLEPSARNEFLKAASDHSDLTRRADRAVRQGTLELPKTRAAV